MVNESEGRKEISIEKQIKKSEGFNTISDIKKDATKKIADDTEDRKEINKTMSFSDAKEEFERHLNSGEKHRIIKGLEIFLNTAETKEEKKEAENMFSGAILTGVFDNKADIYKMVEKYQNILDKNKEEYTQEKILNFIKENESCYGDKKFLKNLAKYKKGIMSFVKRLIGSKNINSDRKNIILEIYPSFVAAVEKTNSEQE